MMNAEIPEYRKILREELNRRSAKNPRYPMRAFAKALDCNLATLSLALSGKADLSLANAERLVQRLNLDPRQGALFLHSVADRQSGRATTLKRKSRRLADFRKRNPQSPASTGHSPSEAAENQDIDRFRVASDWYHAAILELAESPGFEPKAAWVAAELGITPTEAKLALDRLIELHFLQKNEDGRLRKNPGAFEAVRADQGPAAFRRRQRQIRELAIASLEEDPSDSSEMTSIPLRIDPALLPEARRRIALFQKELREFLATGGTERSRVYELETGLFPLQRRPDGRG